MLACGRDCLCACVLVCGCECSARTLPPRILVQGVLHVQTIRGEGLADRDTFTKQDPYVKLFLYDGRRKVSCGIRSVALLVTGV